MEQEHIAPPTILDRSISSILPRLTLENLIAILILILAIVSRFYNVDLRVMSHDEVNHVVPAFDLFQGRGYSYDPVTHGPLQFHLIALAYFFLGDSDFSARIPAVLFSIVTVGVVLIAFRRYLGRSGALIAGFLYLISPFMLFYGRYTRNEAFEGLWTVITIYSALRYMEKGDRFSLYLITLVTAFHFTDKATSFIYTAQLMLFLLVLFLKDISELRWPNPKSRTWFTLLMGLTLVGLLVALGMGIWNANLEGIPLGVGGQQPQNVAGGITKSFSPQFIGEMIGIVFALITAIGAVYFVIRDLGFKVIRSQRTFDLLILLGTLVLPQLSTFPLRTLGWDPLDYSPTGIQRTAIVVMILFVLSVLIGLWWNRRLWVRLAVIFYAIFTLFYTTFFTNGQGFFKGLVAALGYWVSQQGVQRGSQPIYYYLAVQIPVYEYLPALGALMALYFGLRHRLLATIPGLAPGKQPGLAVVETTTEMPDLIDHDDDATIDPDKQHLDTDPASENHPVESPKTIPVLALTLFWSLTSLVAYSLAGEKMPWLTLHIAGGMILSAGWGLGYLVDKIPWGKMNRSGFLAVFLLPVFFASFSSMLGSFLGTRPPFQGNTINQLGDTSTFILAALVSVISLWGILRLLASWRIVQIIRLGVLALFCMMAVLTARTAFTASYINYDTATEFLVYAHAARGPKDVLAQVEEISRRITGGLDIEVAYDNDALYPYWWYLRNYPNHKWYQDKVTRDLRQSPLIIAGESTYSKVDPIVKDTHVMFNYMRLWWPNQEYFGLTFTRIWNAISDPVMREALFDIWLNRDFARYAEVSGKTNLSLENWEPGSHMHFYIRKDIIEQMWKYGASPVSSVGAPEIDEYAQKTITLAPDFNFGMEGPEPGQLGQPRGIAFAPDGSVYISEQRNNRIQHFSPEGQILQTWGSFADLAKGEAPGGTFYEPWGIAVGPDGTVYVADTWNNRIQSFTPDGKFIRMWGVSGTGETPFAFWGPRGLAVDSKGQVYVTDTGNKRVVVFTANGEHVTQFGASGAEPIHLNEPVGLAIDKEGKVYVADTWNQLIQVFVPLPDGKSFVFSRSWEVKAWSGQSVNNKPFIAVDQSNNVFITDPEKFRIIQFNPEGSLVRVWGDTGEDASSLYQPAGISVDSFGRIWVADADANRIVRYTLPKPVLVPSPTATSISITPTSSVVLNELISPMPTGVLNQTSQGEMILPANSSTPTPIVIVPEISSTP